MVLPTLAALDHITPSGTVTSLIPDFISSPIFTDTGSGEVNTAIIVISANNGKYITSSPVIDGYDLIYLALLDDHNNFFSHVYEVILTVPVETKDSGTKLELHLVGIEHNVQKINYIKPWYGAGAYDVATDIANYYNANIGSKQPKIFGITASNISLPNWTLNNYDFGLNQETCYNRILQLTDKMGASVGGGGVLDFFDVDFSATSGSNVPPTMIMNIKSSGSTGSGVIIQNTTSVNVGPTEGGIQASRGFLVCAWGDAESGSLHPDWSRFSSQETMFGLHPQWDSTVLYLVDARVQDGGIHYKCILQITSPGTHPSSDPKHWSVITTNSEYGNTITYSYFTRNNQQLWKNSGCNPLNDPGLYGIGGIGCYDGNLVVWDDDSYRTWVNCRASSPSSITGDLQLSKTLYGGTDFYRGYRVLVDTSAPGAPWNVNDPNGNSFANNIAEYNGTTWYVKFTMPNGSVCASLFDGICFKKSGGIWSDVSGNNNGNDCFHPWSNFSNIPGIYGTNDTYGGSPVDTTFTANTNSAIRVEYRWGISGFAQDTTKNWYQAGAWINFSVPFPESTMGGIGQGVGLLYGGSIQSGGVPDSNKEPATIDAENMHLTHDGYRGFNKASSNDYGNLSSIDFFMRIWYQAPTSLTILNQPDWTKPVYNIQAANFQMRCCIYDTSDNVVYQDFQIPFSGTWAPIKLPLSGFQLYRARRPVKTTFDNIIPPKALDSNNVFEWRNIKRIVVFTLDSYDSNGRYLPYDAASTFGAGSKFYSLTVNDAATGIIINPLFSVYRRIMLDIDAFRFTKPLFVTTGVVSDRNIEPDFIERPTLILYDNLSNEAFSQLAINKFRHIEYDLETTGTFDTAHGDSLYLFNTRLVPNRLSDGTPVPITNASGSGDLIYPNSNMPSTATYQNGFYDNTVKLVAKRIEYSITKPSDSPGGFLRKIVGIKRFTA